MAMASTAAETILEAAAPPSPQSPLSRAAAIRASESTIDKPDFIVGAGNGIGDGTAVSGGAVKVEPPRLPVPLIPRGSIIMPPPPLLRGRCGIP